MRRALRFGSFWVTCFQVAAHEDQTAGAALAVGGADPGLGAPDLFLQVGALASLGLLKLFFLRF